MAGNSSNAGLDWGQTDGRNLLSPSLETVPNNARVDRYAKGAAKPKDKRPSFRDYLVRKARHAEE